MKEIQAFLVLLSICTIANAQPRSSGKRPNILLIVADDLGYNDVGFLGSRFYETPNLDKLAKRSFVFKNGYSNSAVCSPSRASILKGQFTARHEITDFIGAREGINWRKNNRHDRMLPPYYKKEFDKQDTLLPLILKMNGYNTYFIGKWHLTQESQTPNQFGFDQNIGGLNAGLPKGGYFSPYKNPFLDDGPPGENLTMRLATEASKIIKNNNGDPFFIQLCFYAVHGPLETTRQKWEKYRKKADSLGIDPNGFAMGKVLPFRKHQDNPVYAGLIESMDEAVGEILNTLKTTGLEDNTLVIFTSDNGGAISGDPYATSLLPLRGGKGFSYEGGIRVPFIIHYPSGKNKQFAGVEQTSVIGSDIFPTILEYAGIAAAPSIHRDGVSLLPLMSGGKIKERSLIWHYPHYGNQGGAPSSVIRKKNWKLIYFYEDKKIELYNLQTDSSESHNLQYKHPAICKSLFNEMMSYLKKVKARFPVPDDQFDYNKRLDWEKNIRMEILPTLEKKRKEMLSEHFQGENNWWESEVVD